MIVRIIIFVWLSLFAALVLLGLTPLVSMLHPLSLDTINMIVKVASVLGILIISIGVGFLIASAWTDLRRG